MPKHRPVKRKAGHQTTALHGLTSDGRDIVMIDKLRVAILRDGDTYVAQGLEIDYAAEGSTIDEAKDCFAQGLMLTLHENIRVFGRIDNVLRTVPPQLWQDLMTKNVLSSIHSQISAARVRQLWVTSARAVEDDATASLPPIGTIDYYLQQQERQLHPHA
jgi:hypothetical protein